MGEVQGKTGSFQYLPLIGAQIWLTTERTYWFAHNCPVYAFLSQKVLEQSSDYTTISSIFKDLFVYAPGYGYILDRANGWGPLVVFLNFLFQLSCFRTDSIA